MPKIDKGAVMRDAHRRYRNSLRIGLDFTFAQCLSTAWAAAKMRRDAFRSPPARRGIDRPFPQQIAA